MNIFKKIFSKSRSQEGGIFFDTIQKILGFEPISIDFYKKAFTHRSSNKLDELGISDTPQNISNKINRGTFGAIFMLQILKAIGCNEIRL